MLISMKIQKLILLLSIVVLSASCNRKENVFPTGNGMVCGINQQLLSVKQTCFPIIVLEDGFMKGGMLIKGYEEYNFNGDGDIINHIYVMQHIINEYPFWDRYIPYQEKFSFNGLSIGNDDQIKTDKKGRIVNLKIYLNSRLNDEYFIQIDKKKKELVYTHNNCYDVDDILGYEKMTYKFDNSVWWYINKDKELVTNALMTKLDSVYFENEEETLSHYEFKYSFDVKGNWISRITYHDDVPIFLTEREIIYSDSSISKFHHSDSEYPNIMICDSSYGWPIVISNDFRPTIDLNYKNQKLAELIQSSRGKISKTDDIIACNMLLKSADVYLNYTYPKQVTVNMGCYVVSESSDTAKAYYMTDKRGFIMHNREYFERAHFGENNAVEYIKNNLH